MVTQLLLLDGNKTWTLVEGLLAIGAGCQIELGLLLLVDGLCGEKKKLLS